MQLNEDSLRDIKTTVIEMRKLCESTEKRLTNLENQSENLRTQVNQESARQMILTASAIALSIGIVVIFFPGKAIPASILLILGLASLIFGIAAPGKLIAKKL